MDHEAMPGDERAPEWKEPGSQKARDYLISSGLSSFGFVLTAREINIFLIQAIISVLCVLFYYMLPYRILLDKLTSFVLFF